MSENTNTVVGPINVPNAAETVVATVNTPGINNPGGSGILVSGLVNLTTGAGTTAVVVTVRNGSLAGPVVGVAQTETVGAAVSITIPFAAQDPTNVQGAQTYVVTVTQTSANGAGTVNFGVISEEPINRSDG